MITFIEKLPLQFRSYNALTASCLKPWSHISFWTLKTFQTYSYEYSYAYRSTTVETKKYFRVSNYVN